MQARSQRKGADAQSRKPNCRDTDFTNWHELEKFVRIREIRVEIRGSAAATIWNEQSQRRTLPSQRGTVRLYSR